MNPLEKKYQQRKIAARYAFKLLDECKDRHGMVCWPGTAYITDAILSAFKDYRRLLKKQGQLQ